MRRHRHCALLIAILAVASQCLFGTAAVASETRKARAAREAAAARLITAEGALEQITLPLRAVLAETLSGKEGDPAVLAFFGDEVFRMVAERLPDLRDELAETYAKRLSDDDIAAYTAFFESDPGKAYAAATGAAAVRKFQLGRQLDETDATLRQRLGDAAREIGIRLPEDFAQE